MDRDHYERYFSSLLLWLSFAHIPGPGQFLVLVPALALALASWSWSPLVTAPRGRSCLRRCCQPTAAGSRFLPFEI